MSTKTKHLIAPIDRHEGILRGIHTYGITDIHLICHQKQQQKGICLLEQTFNNVLAIDKNILESTDLLSVSEYVALLIDSISGDKTTDIYVDVTSGEYEICLGVLFGAYSRIKFINRILYTDFSSCKTNTLPKLGYNINKGQREALSMLSKTKRKLSLGDIASSHPLTGALVYRYMNDLTNKTAVDKENKFFDLTYYGRLLLL